MLNVIICANFGVEKLRGLGNTRGEILEFPIEVAGHLYSRAGASAQPVIQFNMLADAAASQLSQPIIRLFSFTAQQSIF